MYRHEKLRLLLTSAIPTPRAADVTAATNVMQNTLYTYRSTLNMVSSDKPRNLSQMLDPFHHFTPPRSTLEMATASAVGDALSLQILDNRKRLAEPLLGFRSLRIVSTHAVLMTQTMLHHPALGSDAVLDVLNPLASMLSDLRSDKPEVVTANTIVRAFAAVLAAMSEPADTDLRSPVEDASPASAPSFARAELLTAMGARWSSAIDIPVKRTEAPFIDGLEVLDPISGAAAAGSEILLPCLMPKDWAAWQYPNKANASSRDTFFRYAGIPLAWSPDQMAGMGTTETTLPTGERRALNKPTDASGMTGQSYGADLVGGAEEVRLVASANGSSIQLLPKRHAAPDTAPSWVYCLVRIPTSYSPYSLSRQFGPFNATGRALLTQGQTKAREHPFRAELPVPVPSRWLSADAPLFGQAEGEEKPLCAARALTLTAGARGDHGLGGFGPWAALFSGARYVPAALLSGHMTASEGLRAEIGEERMSMDTSEPLPVPNEELMKTLMAVQDPQSGKTYLDRRGAARTAKAGHEFGLTYPVVNRDMYGRYLARGDITVAHRLIGAGAASCTAVLIRQIAGGRFGPLATRWLNAALAQLPAMVDLSETLVCLQAPGMIEKALATPLAGSGSSNRDTVKTTAPGALGKKPRTVVYRGEESAPVRGWRAMLEQAQDKTASQAMEALSAETLAVAFETLAAAAYPSASTGLAQMRDVVLARNKRVIKGAKG